MGTYPSPRRGPVSRLSLGCRPRCHSVVPAHRGTCSLLDGELPGPCGPWARSLSSACVLVSQEQTVLGMALSRSQEGVIHPVALLTGRCAWLIPAGDFRTSVAQGSFPGSWPQDGGRGGQARAQHWEESMKKAQGAIQTQVLRADRGRVLPSSLQG